MDLQQFVNHFDTMTCILSVEKKRRRFLRGDPDCDREQGIYRIH